VHQAKALFEVGLWAKAAAGESDLSGKGEIAFSRLGFPKGQGVPDEGGVARPSGAD
jgi:hypothetical protein